MRMSIIFILGIMLACQIQNKKLDKAENTPELVAEISSKWCQYRLYFTWSEEIKAISYTITFDLKFPHNKSKEAHELLALINEKLWIL